MNLYHFFVSKLHNSYVLLVLYCIAVNNSCTTASDEDGRQDYCHENKCASLDSCPLPVRNNVHKDKKLNVDRSMWEMDNSKMTSLAVVPYDEANIPLHRKSVRHFAIAGHKFTIQQDYLGLGVAACVWDSAVVLAKYLAKNKQLVEGLKVLELGAGTGLTGLVAATLGADVTVTERAEVMTHLTSSITQNTQEKSWKISAQVLDWTEKLDTQSFQNYDVILGADIIYIESTFQDLLRTISTLAPTSTVHILLSCRIRYDRDVRFLDMLKEDFSVNEIFDDIEKKVQIFSVRRRP